jgi:hypothetical protein
VCWERKAQNKAQNNEPPDKLGKCPHRSLLDNLFIDDYLTAPLKKVNKLEVAGLVAADWLRERVRLTGSADQLSSI